MSDQGTTDNGQNAADNQAGEAVKQKSKLRWVWRGLAIGLVLVILLVLMIPTLISSSAGRGFITSKISSGMPGEVKIDELSLGWFSGQRVGGVKVLDAQGAEILSVDTVDIPDVSLMGLLTGSTDFGVIRIKGVNATIEQYDDGSTNLDKSFGGAKTSHTTKSKPSKAGAAGPPMSFKIDISDVNVTYKSPGMEPAAIKKLAMQVDATDVKQVMAKFSADLTYGQDEGDIDMTAKITNLVDGNGLPQPDKANFDAAVKLRNVPVVVLDRAGKSDGKLVALLGDILEGDITVKGDQNNLDAVVKASSKNLDAKFEMKSRDMKVNVKPGSAVRLTLDKKAFAKLSENEKLAKMLQRPIKVAMVVEQLKVAEGKAGQPIEGNIDAVVTVSDIELDSGDPTLGKLAVRNTNLKISSDDLAEELRITGGMAAYRGNSKGLVEIDGVVSNIDDPQNATAKIQTLIKQLPLAVFDELKGLDGLLVAAIGAELNAELTADMKLTEQPTGDFAVKADAERLHVETGGRLYADRIELDRNGTIEWEVDNTLLKALNKGKEGADIQLTTPATFVVQPIATVYIDGDKKNTVEATLAINGKSGMLAGNEQLAGMKLENLSVKVGPVVAKDGKLLQPLKATIESDLLVDNDHAILLTNVDVTQTGDVQEVKFNVSANDLPVALIERFSEQDELIKELLGEKVERIELSGAPTKPGSNSMAIQGWIDAAHVTMNLKGQVTPGEVVKLETFSSKLTVTPQVYALMQKKPESDADAKPLVLTETATINAAMEDVVLVLSEKGWQPQGSRLSAKVDCSPMTFEKEDVEQTIRVNNLAVKAASKDLSDKLTADVTGLIELLSQGQDPVTGKIDSSTVITRLVNASGEFDPANAMIKTKSNLTDLPVTAIDDLLQLDGMATGALGEQAAVKMTGEYPGNLDMNIDSPNTQAVAKFVVTQLADGGVHVDLREDVVAKMEITPELSQSLLKRGSPVLVDLQSGEEPLTLTILEEAFKMVQGSDYLKTTEAEIHLDIGKVKMSGDGWAREGVLGLLKKFGANVSEEETVDAEFTKLIVKVKDGIVTTNDLWFRSDDMTVGSQGTVNLVTGEVDMVLGVSGSTLKLINELASSDVIPQDYVYEVPVRGNLNQTLQADFGDLVIQITSMVAKKQGVKAAGEWGGLVSIVTDAVTEDLRQQQYEWPNKPEDVFYPQPNEEQEEEPVKEESKVEQPEKQQQAKEEEKPKEEVSDEEKAIRGFLKMIQ